MNDSVESGSAETETSSTPDIPVKPSGAVPILVWWLRKLFWYGARTICPRCEQGEMFESFFGIRKRCPACRIKFQPYKGDELGVIAVGYFLTVIPSLLGVAAAYSAFDWSAAQLLGFFFFLMTTILIGFYKYMKGIWVAFVFLLTGLRKRL